MSDRQTGARVEYPWNNDRGSYCTVNVIGSGAYGVVYKGYDRNRPERQLAIKRTKMRLSKEGVPQSVLREIAFLRQLEGLHNPNVVQLIDVIHGITGNNQEFYLDLIFELCQFDLSVYLKKVAPLSDKLVREISQQILMGIDFLHSQSIVHRDIKPQNILLSIDGHVKLTDFGLARFYSFNTELSSTVVTLWYRSPEVLLLCSYDLSVDLWSFGCILVELFTKHELFPGQSELDQLNRIFQVIGCPPANQWPTDAILPRNNFVHLKGTGLVTKVPTASKSALDLIQKLLSFDLKRRLSAKNALLHPFFSESGSTNSAAKRTKLNDGASNNNNNC